MGDASFCQLLALENGGKARLHAVRLAEAGPAGVARYARGRAIGAWAGTSGFALAAGPVVGGVLVGVWNWRGIFWFNLAFGLAALIVAAVILPERADPTAARVDTAGTLLGAGALATLVFAIIDAESAGFGSASVIILLCASAVLLAAFTWRERRAPNPLLDLRFLRVPQFTTANIAAFCAYFSTFAIFFFAALYLVEVVGASGYRLAAVFLPMTVLMIVSSVLAGRWTVLAGPRWSITIGCLLFAAGLFLAGGYLSPHPDYGPLMVALALAGIGIGTTVVPITSSVLAAVPPERSGMAASAANTSREIGAVTGVAVLGLPVISQLRSSLTSQLHHLGIPAQFQALVINAIETGQIRRTPPPTPASARSSRRSSARWRSPPGCSPSSSCPHAPPPTRTSPSRPGSTTEDLHDYFRRNYVSTYGPARND